MYIHIIPSNSFASSTHNSSPSSDSKFQVKFPTYPQIFLITHQISAVHLFIPLHLFLLHLIPCLPDDQVPQCFVRINILLHYHFYAIATVTYSSVDRGRFGRVSMIGRPDRRNDSGSVLYLWLFTGLSGRGLIYPGLFGRMPAAAIK